MAFIAHFDLEFHQIEVKTAFLNRDLHEKVYMVEEGEPHKTSKKRGKKNKNKRKSDNCYFLWSVIIRMSASFGKEEREQFSR